MKWSRTFVLFVVLAGMVGMAMVHPADCNGICDGKYCKSICESSGNGHCYGLCDGIYCKKDCDGICDGTYCKNLCDCCMN